MQASRAQNTGMEGTGLNRERGQENAGCSFTIFNRKVCFILRGKQNCPT